MSTAAMKRSTTHPLRFGALAIAATALGLAAVAPNRYARSVLALVEPPVAPNKLRAAQPKVSFRHAKVCDASTLRVEPCIVPGGVPDAALTEFLKATAEQSFSVNNQPPGVGSFSSTWAGKAPRRVGVPNTTQAPFRQTTVAALQRGDGPTHSYSGFRSFNYSDYLPLLEPLVNGSQPVFGGQGGPMPDRADLFVGDLTEDMATAAIHANQFEISTTVQVFGEKIWSFVTPQCMFDELGAYHIGGFIGPYVVGADAWERCEITTVHARPGDVIAFPKGWPHQIYTLAGPNMMINFRSDGFNVLDVDDVFALAHHLIIQSLYVGGKKAKALCASGVEHQPTAYGHGLPTPSTWFGRFKQRFAFNRKADLRHCAGVPAGDLLKNYEWKAAQNAPDPETGRQYLRDARSFHGISL